MPHCVSMASWVGNEQAAQEQAWSVQREQTICCSADKHAASVNLMISIHCQVGRQMQSAASATKVLSLGEHIRDQTLSGLQLQLYQLQWHDSQKQEQSHRNNASLLQVSLQNPKPRSLNCTPPQHHNCCAECWLLDPRQL